MLGPHTSAGRNPTQPSDSYFVKQHIRQPRAFRSQKNNLISFRSRSLDQAMRKSFTISGSRSTKQPSKKMARCRRIRKKQRTTSSSLPKKHKALQRFESSPRRDLRCGHGGRAAGQVRVLPHRQRLHYLIQHDPQGNKVIRIRDKAETYDRIRGAVAHVPSKITLVTAPWKRRRKVHPIAKVIGTHPARGARSNNKSRKQGGNLLRTRTPMHLQRKGNFEDDEKTSESLNFQKKGNFEDNEKTSSRVQRHSCNQEDIIGTTFCSCVAFSDCTPRRLRSSTFRLELRRTQQSTAAIWQGQRSSSKCRHKRSQNWKHQREKEVQLHCGKVGCGPDLPRTSSIRRSSVKKIAKSGTTSRPRMTS